MVRRMSLPTLTLITPSTSTLFLRPFSRSMLRNFKLCLHYQRQCVDVFTRRADLQAQKKLLEDRFQAWAQKNASVLSSGAKSAVESLVAQFADLAFRTEQPKAISRHEEERAKRAKQREELTKAEAGFRLMDVNKPLAMAMLEQTTLSSKSSPNRHHVVPPNGALAYFLKQHPHLAEKCKRPYAYKARGRSKSSQKSGASSVGRRSANRTSAKSSGSKSGEPYRVSYLLLSAQRKRHTQAARRSFFH